MQHAVAGLDTVSSRKRPRRAAVPSSTRPVTGSKLQAAAGELLFLVGGQADTLERARPVLDAMGRGVVHLGPHGSGAFLKLVNNFLVGVQAASLAEALALVERSDLSPRHGARGADRRRAR